MLAGAASTLSYGPCCFHGPPSSLPDANLLSLLLFYWLGIELLLQASVVSPLKRLLRKMPYKICGQSRSDNRSSIAETVDEFIEVFDL